MYKNNFSYPHAFRCGVFSSVLFYKDKVINYFLMYKQKSPITIVSFYEGNQNQN